MHELITAADPKKLLGVLPLSDTRWQLLNYLNGDPADKWVARRQQDVAEHFSKQMITWGRRTELIEPMPHGGFRLTDLGRAVITMNDEHSLSIGAKFLGGSPIKGLGGRYGTRGRCRCRWVGETNEPQRGPGMNGIKTIKLAHVEHLRELLNQRDEQ